MQFLVLKENAYLIYEGYPLATSLATFAFDSFFLPTGPPKYVVTKKNSIKTGLSAVKLIVEPFKIHKRSVASCVTYFHTTKMRIPNLCASAIFDRTVHLKFYQLENLLCFGNENWAVDRVVRCNCVFWKLFLWILLNEATKLKTESSQNST